MAITREKKTAIVRDLAERIDGVASLVFVQFTKLGVRETTLMRKGLREKGVGYRVAKKTLMKRVLGERGIAGTQPKLPGEVALAYGTDALLPAREVYAFQKQYKDQLSIVGGVFENRYMDAAEMIAVASIPPLQVLRGQFVQLINSPIQRFAFVLNQIAEKRA